MSEITTTRATLVSTGEHVAGHVAARRRFGEDYSDAEYVEAVEAARMRGAGEEYANLVLGVDDDAAVAGVEQHGGEDVVQAAERRLRGRGIEPARATYREYANALAEVSA